MLPALHCWYCTDWRAPYGVLWYIVSYPGSFGGPAGYILYVAVVDCFAMWSIRRFGLFWPYVACSFWIFLQAPYDIPILWLTLLGLIAWPLASFGILGKLPFLAPRYVWERVFTTIGNAVASDWLYYELMGVVFICTIAQNIVNRRILKQGRINGEIHVSTC